MEQTEHSGPADTPGGGGAGGGGERGGRGGGEVEGDGGGDDDDGLPSWSWWWSWSCSWLWSSLSSSSSPSGGGGGEREKSSTCAWPLEQLGRLGLAQCWYGTQTSSCTREWGSGGNHTQIGTQWHSMALLLRARVGIRGQSGLPSGSQQVAISGHQGAIMWSSMTNR